MNRRRLRVQPGQRTGRDVATGMLALVALIALVVGLPLLLSVVAPLHLPAQVPTWTQVRDTLLGPDDGTLFLGFLTLIAWAGWAYLLLAVLVEVTAALRGLPARHHAGLSLAQPVAASLVTAVTLLLSAPAGQAGAPAPTTRAVATALHEVPTAFTTPLTGPEHSAAPATGQRPPANTPGSHHPGSTPSTSTETAGPVLEVTVRRGDTLWSLAETHLGDGTRFRQIAQANYGRPQADGRSLTEAHWIYPGWVLRIPGATTSPEPAASHTRSDASDAERRDSSETTTYVVRPGDTLWDIAEDHLGEGTDYPRIARASRDIVQDDGAKLYDPDLIRPDWRLRIPGDHTRSRQDPAPDRAARQAPPQPSPSPSRSPGPSGESGSSPPAGVPVPSLTPSAPASTAAASPAAAQPTDPAAPPESTSPPATSPNPADTAGATVLPHQAPADTVPDPDDPGRGDAGPGEVQRSDAAVRSGVDVPGGWMDYPLAAALASLIALVWAWRRHRHTYTPEDLLTPPGQGDEDLAELPTIFTRSHSVVRAYAPALLDAPDPGPTVAEYLAAKRARANTPGQDPEEELDWLWPPGPDGLDLAGLFGHDDTGISLVGPGAADAARALIVAAVAAGGHDDCYAWTHLVIPTAVAARLLTPPAPRDPDAEPATAGPVVLEGFERVELVTDLEAALEHVERELSRRRRLLAAYQVPDRAGLREAEPLGEPMPLTILLTQAPPANLREHLAALAAQGAPVGISVVVLGPMIAGTTLDISAEGYVAGLDHPREVQDRSPHDQGDPGAAGGSRAAEVPACGPAARVAVLDIDAALDALAGVREAYTGVAAPGRHQDSGLDAAARQVPDAGTASGPEPDTAPPAPAGKDLPGQDSSAAGPGAVSQGRVQVRVLGEPVLYIGDGTPARGLRPQTVQLLVLLAVHRAGASRDDLLDALWPTAIRRTVLQRLFTEISRLRRAIRHVAEDPDVEGVVNTGERYQLDAAVVQVDLWQVLDILRQVGTTTDPQAAITLLRQVLAVAGGRILAQGQDYEWIAPARERLRRSLLRAHQRLTDLLTGTGELGEAAQVALAAVEVDPTSEATARTAMRTLAAAGRHAEIPALLRRLRAALADLDIEPDEETTALARQLRRPPPPQPRQDP